MADFSVHQDKIDQFFKNNGISKLCTNCNGGENAHLIANEVVIMDCINPETKEFQDYQVRMIMFTCKHCGKASFYPEQAVI